MTRIAGAPVLKKLAAVVSVAALAVLAACSTTTGSSAAPGTELSLVAFSVPKPAYDDLQKAFSDSADGKGIAWKSSYGASGDQARAVISGLKADYVGFSLATDMTKLVDKDLVAKDWNAGANKGIVSTSVVTIVVRKGNPLGIKGWDDLIKPGVKIVTPNPGSSGSARWNILAAWSNVTANGGSEAEAETYLTKYYQNIVSLPSSGREATSAFTSGTGDVLISYENEAIAARQSGADVDYLIPDTTLKIENPGAVTTTAPDSAKKFLSYVISDEGQKVFAAHGFRPLNESVDPGTVEGANDPSKPFPAVKKLVTIDDLGGWPAAATKFFDEKTGIVTKIQDASGVS
jgi:sulfate/thiosulfate-binding protein